MLALACPGYTGNGRRSRERGQVWHDFWHDEPRSARSLGALRAVGVLSVLLVLRVRDLLTVGLSGTSCVGLGVTSTASGRGLEKITHEHTD